MIKQYINDTDNYVVKDDMSLGEGRTEHTVYPKGCKEGRNPVIKGSEGSKGSYGAEQKVGDHHEYE